MEVVVSPPETASWQNFKEEQQFQTTSLFPSSCIQKDKDNKVASCCIILCEFLSDRKESFVFGLVTLKGFKSAQWE